MISNFMKMTKCSLKGLKTLWEKEKSLIGETARYEQFLLFTQCFQKAYTADT